MPTYRQGPSSQILRLQDEITHEVNTDAQHLATSVFGKPGDMPDVARVSDEQLDGRFRSAYENGDRKWLLSEAQRDPEQFIKVARRIGVLLPEEFGQQPQTMPPPVASLPPSLPAAPMPAPAAPPPGGVPVPAPVAPPQIAAPVQAPAPLAAPPQPQPQPQLPMVAMAEGGIVTEPTIALLGEAGPEMVVPMAGQQGPGATLQPPPTPPTPQAAEPSFQMPQYGDIQNYIDKAARSRGIDPEVAMAVAYHEGGRNMSKWPTQPAFTEPAVEGDFSGKPLYSGKSYWPFQLHYGGPGYEQFGRTAGMGNDFTKATGYQPGDPRAWQASIDFALDEALRTGWSKFYGRGPAQVGVWQGIPRGA